MATENPERIEWGSSQAGAFFLEKTREHLDPTVNVFRTYQAALGELDEAAAPDEGAGERYCRKAALPL